MSAVKRKLSRTFKNFFDSEKSGGILLVACTAVSLAVTNSPAGESYLGLWHTYVAGLSVEHWVNDALMAVFFLLIGLELERELYVGELSDFRNALLPIVAALGGIAFPALIHFTFNAGAPTRAGVGIPMAIFITNLAFPGDAGEVNASKMAILAASLTAGVAGFLWLRLLGGPVSGDDDTDAMDFAPVPGP